MIDFLEFDVCYLCVIGVVVVVVLIVMYGVVYFIGCVNGKSVVMCDNVIVVQCVY